MVTVFLWLQSCLLLTTLCPGPRGTLASFCFSVNGWTRVCEGNIRLSFQMERPPPPLVLSKRDFQAKPDWDKGVWGHSGLGVGIRCKATHRTVNLINPFRNDLTRLWLGSIILIHQGWGLYPQSGHTWESTNECINTWSNEPISLSLSQINKTYPWVWI